DDPTGYGRLVRGKDDRVTRIVEQGDADPDELAIDEINTSFYCFKRSLLAPALRRLTDDNVQAEYYLTDVVEVLSAAGHRVEALLADDAGEMLGVNDRLQLAAADAEIGDGSVVGPFCHLRPGAAIAPGTATGPFYTST